LSAETLQRITAAIVNFRTPDLAAECVRALASQHSERFELDIVLVDNGSGDGSAERLALLLADLVEAKRVTLVPLDLNGGFGWGNNEAMLQALAGASPPDAILLLNPDCVPQPGALEALVAELELHPRCAVAGSQLLNPDGSLTGSAFLFHTVGTEFMRGLGLHSVGRLLGIRPVLVPYGQAGEVDWVTGASCLVRVAALRDVGLFDTGFFLYFEEVELMHRMKQAGWSIRHVPKSRVMHIGGASTGVTDSPPEEEKAMPGYWYDSRRRFFTLTRGRDYAKRASLAWLAGARFGRLAGVLLPGKRIRATRAEEAGLRARGIHPLPRDSERAITHVGDRPGVSPRWMDKAD
jgi:hypothetical protein